MCYSDLCIQLFFFSKGNVKSLSGQNFKKVNIKNIKMKPPVAQFKKKSKKLFAFNPLMPGGKKKVTHT